MCTFVGKGQRIACDGDCDGGIRFRNDFPVTAKVTLDFEASNMRLLVNNSPIWTEDYVHRSKPVFYLAPGANVDLWENGEYGFVILYNAKLGTCS